MHVLTLPRVLRRHDGGEESENWLPVTVPVTEPVDQVDTAAPTQRVVRRVDGVELPGVARAAWSSTAAFSRPSRVASSSCGPRSRRRGTSTASSTSCAPSASVVSRCRRTASCWLIGVAGALTLLATLLTLAAACAYNVVGAVGHGLVLKMSEPIVGDTVSTPAPTEDVGPKDVAPAEDGASHAA